MVHVLVGLLKIHGEETRDEKKKNKRLLCFLKFQLLISCLNFMKPVSGNPKEGDDDVARHAITLPHIS